MIRSNAQNLAKMTAYHEITASATGIVSNAAHGSYETACDQERQDNTTTVSFRFLHTTEKRLHIEGGEPYTLLHVAAVKV